MKNNPWITEGIISSVNTKHKLHHSWKKSFSKKNPNGDTKLYENYKYYRKVLRNTIKKAKSKYYCNKITGHKGDMKKTWEFINKLRGKKKREIKPEFIIDNEKIINRRIIANEFNKYFVSVASKLNDTLNENVEIKNGKIPSFNEYIFTEIKYVKYFSL